MTIVSISSKLPFFRAVRTVRTVRPVRPVRPVSVLSVSSWLVLGSSYGGLVLANTLKYSAENEYQGSMPTNDEQTFNLQRDTLVRPAHMIGKVRARTGL